MRNEEDLLRTAQVEQFPQHRDISRRVLRVQCPQCLIAPDRAARLAAPHAHVCAERSSHALLDDDALAAGQVTDVPHLPTVLVVQDVDRELLLQVLPVRRRDLCDELDSEPRPVADREQLVCEV